MWLLFVAKQGFSTNYIADGYMGRLSYTQGDTATAYINAQNTFTNVKMYLRNINGKKVDSVVVNLVHQHIASSHAARPWSLGFGYAPSFKYMIPNNLPSGIYSWENKVFFIVKNSRKNADITFIYPSNTETAYGNAGGKCFYNDGSTDWQQSDTLSFLRPLTIANLTYTRKYSEPFMKWINTQSQYNFQVICDQDLDDYSEIQNSKLICVVGHSEYWTRKARENFDQFVNAGGDAVVLSGNTSCWQVRYHPTDKTKIICYKDASADPEPNLLLKTIMWASPSLNYPVLKSLGVDWPHGAYPPSPIPGAYHGWGGYKIVLPNSPLLAGTNLHFHDTIACKTREYDGSLVHHYNTYGDPVLDTNALGFCKIELIGYDEGEEDFHSAPAKGHGMFIAFKKSAASGNVVNVGGTHWCANTSANGWPGGWGARDSSKIKKITMNIFNLLLSKSNIYTNTHASCTTASINYIAGSTSLELFPNPSTGIFVVKKEANDSFDYTAEVYNMMGQKCFEGKLNNEIDLSNQSDGMYFISIKMPDGSALTKRVIISK